MPPIKKVVIIGPESTGKSTLAKGLAERFNEPWVEEFAREYLERLAKPYDYDDLLKIAQGQIALEEKRANEAQKVLFCDTDLHVIQVWSNHKFGKTHPWIVQQIEQRKYDLYFLTAIDIPWQKDPLREHPQPEMRQYFFDIYTNILKDKDAPYHLISGSPHQRLDQATQILMTFLGTA
ncbi:MAG TPA: ATP-binding protein [Cyclobacteriaceae bacterium]|nr:ATP-binding protein [Cyclobacteriaceae bacterium]